FGAFLHIPPRRIRHHLDDIFEFATTKDLRERTISSVPAKFQREIMFATMLTIDPDIVLVDAPIAGKEIGERIRGRLTEIKASGGLVIIATRDIESVAWIADRVITLNRGVIAHDEPFEDALERV